MRPITVNVNKEVNLEASKMLLSYEAIHKKKAHFFFYFFSNAIGCNNANFVFEI